MVNLYLIRHGRQNSSLCNVDAGLSIEGVRQAKLLQTRICGYHIDALYSSTMLRAKQTADIINEELHLSIEIRDELREISFGWLEGNTEEYIEKHFQEFIEEQKKLQEDIPYPGGENGALVNERAMPVIMDIVRSGSQNIAVVTHGGTIRALLAELFGKDQAKRFLFGVSLENTGITQLVYNSGNNRFYLERFNDYAHLETCPGLRRGRHPI